MFRKTSEKPKKESHSSTFVRQDSRTTIKTNTAQSESCTTSIHNDTIFNDANNNNHNNTIIFRSTTRTVTQQQRACVTEINKRYTPTPIELAQMRAEIFTKTVTKTTGSSRTKSNNGYQYQQQQQQQQQQKQSKPLINLLTSRSRITSKNNNNNNDSPPRSQANFKRTTTTTKATSAESHSFDDPFEPPTTPTIVKIQTMDVTESSGCTVTSHTQQQKIKLKGNGQSYNFATTTPPKPTTSSNNEIIKTSNIAAESDNLKLTSLFSALKMKPSTIGRSTYRSPHTIRTPLTTTITKTTTTVPTTKGTTTAIDDKSKYTKPLLKTINVKNLSLPSSNFTPTTITHKSPDNASLRKKSKLQPGYAYIFNNEIFDNPNNEYRVGSSADVSYLRATFEKFKLRVHLIENATLEKIGNAVRNIESKDFTNNSCLVITILSHGARRGEICAKDGTYCIDDKILFPILRNRSLIDKPKIMFIQACKGSMESYGSGGSGGSGGGVALHTDSFQPIGSPNEIFKCYSTFEGYVSYRSEKGSIFIQSLCEFLSVFGGIKNIKDIMEMVALRVKQKSNGRQIPAITSTLTQPYIFGDYV